MRKRPASKAHLPPRVPLVLARSSRESWSISLFPRSKQITRTGLRRHVSGAPPAKESRPKPTEIANPPAPRAAMNCRTGGVSFVTKRKPYRRTALRTLRSVNRVSLKCAGTGARAELPSQRLVTGQVFRPPAIEFGLVLRHPSAPTVSASGGSRSQGRRGNRI